MITHRPEPSVAKFIAYGEKLYRDMSCDPIFHPFENDEIIRKWFDDVKVGSSCAFKMPLENEPVSFDLAKTFVIDWWCRSAKLLIHYRPELELTWPRLEQYSTIHEIGNGKVVEFRFVEMRSEVIERRVPVDSCGRIKT